MPNGTRVRVNGATLLTAEPAIMGTPAYMAPAAILADPAADHPVDLYALGCLAYFLLTGVRVFAGDTTMKLLMQHVQDEPVPPSSRTELPIPRAVDDLVLACLRTDPKMRPRDAQDLQQRAAMVCRGLEPWDRAREGVVESPSAAAHHAWCDHAAVAPLLSWCDRARERD